MTPATLETYMTLWFIKILLFGSIGAITLYFALTLHRINKWLLIEAQKRASGRKS